MAHPVTITAAPTICITERVSPSTSVPAVTATTVTANSTLMARVGPMAVSNRKKITYISALVSRPSTRSHT